MNKILLIFSLSLFMAALPAICYEDALPRARTLLEDGDANSAITLLSEAAEDAEGAERAEILNAKGWTLYTQGRYHDAQEVFDQALAELIRSPQKTELSIRVLNNAGINAFSSGNLIAAKDFFEAALKKHENNTALRYLEIIEQQTPLEVSQTSVSRGIINRFERDFANAIIDYTKALKIYPQNNDALSYRGYAYYRIGSYDKAREDILSALKGSPRRLDAIINILKVDCVSRPEAVEEHLKNYEDVIAANRQTFLDDRELALVCPNIISSWQ